MTTAMDSKVIRLQLLDDEVELPYSELEGSISPYSERPLRKIGLEFDVPAARSTELSGVLRKARDPDGAFAVDGVYWAVASNSHSYTQGAAVHKFRMELEEIEIPKAERVEMLGIALTPTRYQERELDGGVLLISILAEVDTKDDEVLEAAIADLRPEKEYFEAKRIGVSDEVLRVRFGRCLWQQGEDQRLHLLRLVADEENRVGGGAFGRQHEPELARAQEKIVALEEGLNSLVDLLVEAGSLGKEAAAKLEDATADAWSLRCRDFDEAIDIEEFF
jgi:hypothetical protein